MTAHAGGRQFGEKFTISQYLWVKSLWTSIDTKVRDVCGWLRLCPSRQRGGISRLEAYPGIARLRLFATRYQTSFICDDSRVRIWSYRGGIAGREPAPYDHL